MNTTTKTILALFTLTACGGGGESSGDAAGLSGSIKIDGSSTVYPVTEAAAEEFSAKERDVRITIGVSGTGGGFKKFCAGEIDITGASRYIKDSEKELCKSGGIEFIELPVAYDGISVVVHPSNDFVDSLTVEELNTIWGPAGEGKVTKWSDVRPSFPSTDLALFGPGPDSGTFDYFTKVINGESQASRGDYTASEDDNTLVHGVSSNEGGLGYFGFAYYAENQSKLRAVPVKNGESEPVGPSIESIADGSYAPLSRPIFVYVRKDVADRPDVKAFVEFYLGEGLGLAQEVGYISLPEAEASSARTRFANKTTGTAKE